MGKYIVDILDKDKYALEVDIMRNGSPASQRILDAVKVGIPYEERTHGEWIEVDIKPLPYGGYTCNYQCNKCNYFTKEYHLNFCPNCGATMDERSDGNEKSRK